MPAPGTPSGGGGSGKWLLPAAIGVIVVAAAGLFWLLVIDSDDDDSDDSDAETAAETDEDAKDDETESDPEDDDESAGALTYDPERLTGTWEGTYECDSGEADVTLTIDDFPGNDDVGAGWQVSSAGSDEAEGIFYLEGTYVDGQLSLEAFDAGDHYEVVDSDDWHDLEADLSGREDTEVIEATVSGEGCGDVTLERTNTDPWYVGTWSGTYGCNQGSTGAVLSIEATAPDEVRGTYEFYDVGGTVEGYEPVPYGAFHVTSIYEGHELYLESVGWAADADGEILQPPNYTPVPMVNYEPAPIDPTTFFGTFPTEDGCSVFGFERIADEPYGDSQEAEDAAAEFDFSRPEPPEETATED